MGFSKIAINWHTSFTELAVRRLTALVAADPFADFSGLLILAPTAESCRLLREALTAAFAAEGRGVVGLTVIQPEALITPADVAAPFEVITNWMMTLKSARYDQLEALLKNADSLLPLPAPLANIAASIQKCRMELCGEAYSIQSAYESLGENFAYTGINENFSALAALEAAYLRRFPRASRDPAVATLELIARPRLAQNVRKIIAVGCFELKRGVVAALENSGREVEFWLPVPEEELEHFDDHAHPDPNYWCNRELPLDLQSSVRCFSKPVDMAEKLLSALRGGGACSAVGVLDAETADFLLDKDEREREKHHFFLPERRKLAQLPLTRLFLQLFPLAEQNVEFETVASLARNSLVQKYLGLDTEALTSALDRGHSQHLYRTLADLPGVGNSPLASFANSVRDLRRKILLAENRTRALWEVFAEIVKSSAADQSLADKLFELEPLKNTVATAVNSAEVPEEFVPPALKLLLQNQELTGRGNLEARPELVGFMELVWLPETKLTVAGFNEEAFNYGDGSDMFLPDQLKEHLKMQTSRNRYSADSVRFAALLAHYGSDLKIMYCKNTSQGDLLKPARLLMRCEKSQLPKAVTMLFGGELEEPVHHYQGEGVGKFPPYLPRRRMPGNTISATAFKDYLECPFKFYVTRVLGAEEVDDRGQELDALRWGNTVHSVLEEFMAIPESERGRLLSGDNAPALQAKLNALLDRVAAKTFGNGDLGVVELQKALIGRSLTTFADWQTELANEGWETLSVEETLEVPWVEIYPQTKCPEIILKGRFDRVDYREDANGESRMRIVDYKTSSTAEDPAAAHLKNGRWINLQLPLYALMLPHSGSRKIRKLLTPETRVEAAYFNLPPNLADAKAGVRIFPLEDALLHSAGDCAEEVLNKIYLEHAFWPPKLKNRVLAHAENSSDGKTWRDFASGYRNWREGGR